MSYDYLLSGSLAYDNILNFEGKLEDHILPHALSRLNVAFQVTDIKRQFGGTAGNISYNAAMLNQKPLVVGNIGVQDASAYIEHLNKNNVDTKHIKINEGYSANCWILTDSQNNQITSFYQGVMKNDIELPSNTPDIWHLSPENPINTAILAKKAKELNKSYFFDPGQCLPEFLSGKTEHIFSLKQLIENSKGIFVNDYEFELLKDYLKFENVFDILKENQFLIKTMGSSGVNYYCNNETVYQNVYPAKSVVDPTGCGDAFRAGFLYGYTKNFDIDKTLKIASAMGSCAIEASGGQNHKTDEQTILQMSVTKAKMKI